MTPARRKRAARILVMLACVVGSVIAVTASGATQHRTNYLARAERQLNCVGEIAATNNPVVAAYWARAFFIKAAWPYFASILPTQTLLTREYLKQVDVLPFCNVVNDLTTPIIVRDLQHLNLKDLRLTPKQLFAYEQNSKRVEGDLFRWAARQIKAVSS